MIDVERVRLDTPYVTERIHLNNAGSSLSPEIVIDTVVNYLREESRIGGYELAALRNDQIENVYGSIARMIGASASEISRAENATRAWDMAFYSIDFTRGNKVITTQTEYCANYVAYLHLARERGIEISVVENDEFGQLDIGSLEKMLKSGAKMVSINHVPTNSGLVNPAEEIGKLTDEYGVLYLLDACQSVGQMPLDVKKIKCDFLSATGRKFLRAPRGTGFLFVNQNRLEEMHPPIIDAWAAKYTEQNYELYSDRRRFETFEFSHANFLGLGMAINYAENLGINSIWSRVTYLANYLRDRLQEIHGVTVQDIGKVKSGIVTFDVKAADHLTLRDKLIEKGINVSVTREFTALLDMRRRGFESLIRASVHYYNTIEELDIFCETLTDLINYSHS